MEKEILERSFKDTKEEERALEAVNNGYKAMILVWFLENLSEIFS
jgi:hypothetical protein